MSLLCLHTLRMQICKSKHVLIVFRLVCFSFSDVQFSCYYEVMVMLQSVEAPPPGDVTIGHVLKSDCLTEGLRVIWVQTNTHVVHVGGVSDVYME